jgi:hypothetical protein
VWLKGQAEVTGLIWVGLCFELDGGELEVVAVRYVALLVLAVRGRGSG